MKIATLALASALALSGSFAMAQTRSGGDSGGSNAAAGGQGTAGNTQGGRMNNDATSGSSTMGNSTGTTGGMATGSSQTPAINDLSKSSNPGAVESQKGSPGSMSK